MPDGSRVLTVLEPARAGEAVAWAESARDAHLAAEYGLTAATLEDVYVALVGGPGHRDHDQAGRDPGRRDGTARCDPRQPRRRRRSCCVATACSSSGRPADSRGFLPLAIVVQALFDFGIVVGYPLLFPEIDRFTILYLATGAPTITLVTIGLVALPQVVSQAQLEGTQEYMRSLPVPRLTYLLADLTVWLAIVLPGVVFAVVVGGWSSRPSTSRSAGCPTGCR